MKRAERGRFEEKERKQTSLTREGAERIRGGGEVGKQTNGENACFWEHEVGG
jgi:hypothetical protein